MRSKKTTPTILGRTPWKGQGWDRGGRLGLKGTNYSGLEGGGPCRFKKYLNPDKAAVKKWMCLRDLDGEKNEIC